MIAFITGAISTYSSTSGVVYPTFLPTVPALVQKLGGGDPLQIALSINVGAALVDVSPLSTIGALCIAALPEGHDATHLFRRLLAWGISMTARRRAVLPVRDRVVRELETGTQEHRSAELRSTAFPEILRSCDPEILPQMVAIFSTTKMLFSVSWMRTSTV